MTLEEVLEETELKMMKSVDFVQKEFATIRTGKASPALVENVHVDYYGTKTRLRELAGISTPEPRLIVIQPWDPTVMAEVERALLKANLGVTPLNDGKVIRIPIPELNEERRRDLNKVIKRMAEDGRVSIRNIRREANEEIKKLQKNGEITEDDMYRSEKEIQEKTGEYIAEIDKYLSGKENEILEI
jgi:ribosome recycling factor